MNVEQELGSRLQATLQRSEPMSIHTTWKVGGVADYYLAPVSLNDLIEAVRYCRDKEIPLCIIGNGSNLLVLDGGIRGMVIEIGAPFHYLHREGSRIKVGAGSPMSCLARTAAQNGLAGLEFAGGIPGTLGGALVMNAGAFGSHISEVVRAVSVVRFDGLVRTLQKEDIVFEYRASSLSGEGVIFEAVLELETGEITDLEKKVDFYLNERRRRHPQLPSCGSVFRNLPDQPAGRLIEAAGGKGLRVGGAQVSEQHANFIVNLGGATACDIISLIERVRWLVRDKFQVDLHPEVKIVGEEI